MKYWESGLLCISSKLMEHNILYIHQKCQCQHFDKKKTFHTTLNQMFAKKRRRTITIGNRYGTSLIIFGPMERNIKTNVEQLGQQQQTNK